MSRIHSAVNVRADWLAARAMLASRRLRRYRLPAAAGFVAVFLIIYAAKGLLADHSNAVQQVPVRAPASVLDTLSLVARLRQANLLLAERDSILRDVQAQSEAAAQELSIEQRQQRDSLHALSGQLATALDRAAKAPLPASYRALADTRALRPLGAVQVLMDTLALLERTRLALDPVEAPQSEFAQLSRRANALGGNLQAIAHARMSLLARQLSAIETPEARSPASVSMEVRMAQSLRDSVGREVARAESLLRTARDWRATVQARTDSTLRAQSLRILGASPIVAAASAALIALALCFTIAVLVEVKTPTIAHAREVERLARVPVLGIAEDFQVPREGRARLQSGARVDPFRMVYLALTASGARGRVVCVTGDEPWLAVAVAGRLAVNAATDERATLLVDLTPGVPGSSAFFGWRDEPGFTDAIAGVRLWREVARPVGASEGFSLEVVPAGSPRHDTDVSVQDSSARAEFRNFLAEYDLAVLVVLNQAAVEHAGMLCDNPPTILAARIARTKLQSLEKRVSQLRETGMQVHGLFLVDTK